jgi:DNA invertase Pin-like site-specific DNA recombinase
VTKSQVGLVPGMDMSRVARSSKDWRQLLELCAVFGSLLADLDGLYDPGHYNDRLLLGLKGTMSEAELHLLRTRLTEGKWSKAERGELLGRQPTGYVRQPSGEVILDPDEQVQSVIRLIFEKFEELGAGRQVFWHLQKNGIRIPVRLAYGPNQGQLEWREPTPVAQTSSRRARRSVSVCIDNSQPANRSLKGRPRVVQMLRRVAAVGGVN